MADSAARGRMPGSILGVVLLLGAVAVFGVLNLVLPGTWGCPVACVIAPWDPNPPVWFVWTAATFVAVLAAVGTWWRRGVARAVTVAVGVVVAAGGLYLATVPDFVVRELLNFGALGLVGIGLGALIVVLVLVPRSSRQWYG